MDNHTQLPANAVLLTFRNPGKHGSIKAILLAGACLLALALPAKAERVSENWCNDGIQESWHFYCDPEPEPEEEPQPEVTAPSPTPDTPPVTPVDEPEEIMTARERLAVFSESVEEAKAEAILDPTIENLVAYIEGSQRHRNQAVW